MTIWLYNKKDTYMVIGGIVFYHLLVFALCVFWFYKFIIVEFSATVIALLLFFFLMTILCDYLLARVQGFSRFFSKCKIDSDGLHCYYCLKKKWDISWRDISIYGIHGFDSNSLYITLYFTKAATLHKQDIFKLCDSLISFQLNEKRWGKIKNYIPSDICTNIQRSLHEKRDYFFRGKTKKGKATDLRKP